MKKENNSSEITVKIPADVRLSIAMQYRGQKWKFKNIDTNGPWNKMYLSDIMAIFENKDTYEGKEPKELTHFLKPLREISDEDCAELGKIMVVDLKSMGAIPEDAIPWIKSCINKFIEKKYKGIDLEIADFLRSRGYALPYGPYSVEQLVETRIYKITNDGK